MISTLGRFDILIPKKTGFEKTGFEKNGFNKLGFEKLGFTEKLGIFTKNPKMDEKRMKILRF